LSYQPINYKNKKTQDFTNLGFNTISRAYLDHKVTLSINAT